MKKTAEELLEIIKANYSEYQYAFGYWFGANSVQIPKDIRVEDLHNYTLNNIGLGPVKHIHQRGGEGQGTKWYQVWYFENHDVYLRIDGHYTSYNGVDFFDGYGYEVRPSEKTITVYE